ncbi:hypothetical protein BCR34DRAFT_558791 [Clohesyomyces aquaticus]|uniref:DUF7730 domain-containing protein n=1 Tax=Clohesyomyces aquaticus TaxID=1231657 RepID=A0A1Y1ZYV2_9PLEO|nr:hypothetical protein BCR34DRAFT_558791 [Clohesyomyces aquaticus]
MQSTDLHRRKQPHRTLLKSWNFLIRQPYTSITNAIFSWTRRKPIPRLAYAKKPAQPGPPPHLPGHRKRALSLSLVSKPSYLRSLVPGSQKTATQSQSLLLTKLPPEIRFLIWKFTVGNHTLHIIPCLVPSKTQPPVRIRNCMRLPWSRSAHQDFYYRLDHEVCKYEEGSRDHTRCTVWIRDKGEIYFTPSDAFHLGARDLEERYLRWWQRKNRALALLKTCRQIYSEAIPVLYTTNTFSFTSPAPFVQLAPTLLPHRLQSIRYLEFCFLPAVHEYLCRSRERPLQVMAKVLREMEGLKRLIIEFLGKEPLTPSVMNPFLRSLVSVRVEGEFVVRVGWGSAGDEIFCPEASFRYVKGYVVP